MKYGPISPSGVSVHEAALLPELLELEPELLELLELELLELESSLEEPLQAASVMPPNAPLIKPSAERRLRKAWERFVFTPSTPPDVLHRHGYASATYVT